MTRTHHALLSLLTASTLVMAGCGGGGSVDESTAASTPAADGTTGAAAGGSTGASTPGSAAALACNTAGYVAGSVDAPTLTQLAAYAGTYRGDEGRYGQNPGDPFVKSGSAAVVIGSDGTVSYNGVAYSATSICIDTAAGSFGKLLYIVAGKGHLDLADKADPLLGNAWGVSLADGETIFTGGAKQ